MKKFFSALTALLLSICFISCMADEISDSANSQKEGSVILSIKKARTISPAEGISYKNVEKWTVTFQDITAKYDVITVENVNFNSSSQEIRLPLGTYNVTLNGTANNSTLGETAQPVPFYGEDSVTIEENKTVSISVFVAPKQSGTGSFNFMVTTSGFEDYPPSPDVTVNSTDGKNYFTVSLTPYGCENPDPITWIPTVDRKFENDVEIYSFSVSEPVSSGFYTLSIKYTWDVYVEGIPLTKTKEIYYPNHDFLVEIIDKLETTGSVNITVSLEESKNYYATKDANKANGNGAFESMPGYLDNVLDAVNRTTISTANIYIVDEVLTDEISKSYPEIDVSKVNATGKTYCIYTKNEKTQEYNDNICYTITGAAVKGGEPTIYIDSSVRTVTLKNSQSSSGISGRAKIVALENPEFVLKDNTSVFIDLTDVQYEITETTICMPDSTYNSYYAEHPCVTCVTKDNPNFQVCVERLLLTSYSVVTKSSDDGINKTTDFYIIPSDTAELSVTGIPKYSLAATTKYGSVTADTPLYAGDTVKITATTEGSFAEDTSFTWFINGKQYGDSTKESWCEITIGADNNNTDTNNTIICLVSYKGRYATRKTDLNNIRDMTTLLYNNNYMTYGLAYSILGATTFESKYIISSTEISSFPDFCIDADNNVYSIFSGSSGGSKISKATSSELYADRTDYSYRGNGTLSLIKMGNDGKLYVVISNREFGIVTFSTDAASGNSASVNLLINPSDFGISSEEILSFCVDINGSIYVTYKVVSDSGTKIILSKFTNNGNVLSMDSSQSKTLFEITGTDTTITVSSGYFDLPNYIYSNITITDMHCEGDYIYLIMRDVMDSGSPSEFHSLGGVCTISTDLSLPAGKNQFVGWASDIVNTTEDSESVIYTYKHDECFYGPQKIIAIKPKEIILADDGVYIENNVKLNKNRVVVFNLFDNSISKSYDAPLDIDFECYTSGLYDGQ